MDSSNLLAAAIAGASGVTTNRTSVLDAIPFSLTINVYNVTGDIAVPLEGAAVYIWHCDGIGVYSAVALSTAPANKEDTPLLSKTATSRIREGIFSDAGAGASSSLIRPWTPA